MIHRERMANGSSPRTKRQGAHTIDLCVVGHFRSAASLAWRYVCTRCTFCLLAFSISYSGLTGTSVSRGVWLWLLTLFAVAVRETARAMMAAWCRLDLRSVLLLPTGALLSLATHGDDDRAHRRHERAMALAGPIANFVVGITMALLMYAATPAIQSL